MEPLSATFFTFGVILLIASWINLLITSFKEDYTWGLTTLFIAPLSYLYCLFSFDKNRESLSLAGAGVLLLMLS